MKRVLTPFALTKSDWKVSVRCHLFLPPRCFCPDPFDEDIHIFTSVFDASWRASLRPICAKASPRPQHSFVPSSWRFPRVCPPGLRLPGAYLPLLGRPEDRRRTAAQLYRHEAENSSKLPHTPWSDWLYRCAPASA